VTPFKEAEEFAANPASPPASLRFRRADVRGDRSGTIYLVNEIGEGTSFADAEPSMAAYHLAFGPDGHLYVTGPTLSKLRFGDEDQPRRRSDQILLGARRPQGPRLLTATAMSMRSKPPWSSRHRQDHSDAEARWPVAGIGIVGLCI